MLPSHLCLGNERIAFASVSSLEAMVLLGVCFSFERPCVERINMSKTYSISNCAERFAYTYKHLQLGIAASDDFSPPAFYFFFFFLLLSSSRPNDQNFFVSILTQVC
jgi:hypothetical protein